MKKRRRRKRLANLQFNWQCVRFDLLQRTCHRMWSDVRQSWTKEKEQPIKKIEPKVLRTRVETRLKSRWKPWVISVKSTVVCWLDKLLLICFSRKEPIPEVEWCSTQPVATSCEAIDSFQTQVGHPLLKGRPVRTEKGIHRGDVQTSQRLGYAGGPLSDVVSFWCRLQPRQVNVEKITPYVEHPIPIKITTEKEVDIILASIRMHIWSCNHVWFLCMYRWTGKKFEDWATGQPNLVRHQKLPWCTWLPRRFLGF